ncbi:MAG: hypothetical protein DDT19_01067 [Syntrophomonadaceae bacterium]|nr:hypothetical protein [Bacillota bacterium]
MNVADFAVCHHDERLIENGLHFFRICNHVGRNVTAVKLHPFHRIQVGGESFGLLNGDYAILAYFFHSFSNETTDFFVCCCNGRYLGNGFFRLDRLRLGLNFINSNFHSFFNPALNSHRIGAGCNISNPFANNGLS